MTVKRRNFLLFLGAVASSWTLAEDATHSKNWLSGRKTKSALASSPKPTFIADNPLNLPTVNLPIPLKIENISASEQIAAYGSYEVKDDLILPEGFTYDVIAAWGDRVGNSRFGYNNDYLAWIQTAPNEGLLTVNFEYISGKTWMETYPLIIEQELLFEEVIEQLKDREGQIDALSLPENNPLKEQIKLIAKEGLIDQGLGVISVRRNENGKWERTYSDRDRRITGISGLDNPNYALKSTGPATAIFIKQNKLGYEDNLGKKIIGTLQNCAGGTTPWGTVLSAEENFQTQVPEPVMADGSSVNPSQQPFILNQSNVGGTGNIFGLAGNKYGWMVEIDPSNPQDYGTKHTWLGRYRHEAFGIRAISGKNLAVYSGCDRRGGHLYKFISSDRLEDPQDKKNSRLLESGMLYGAKFYPNGIGEWIPLNSDTLVNPVLPSQVVGNMVKLPHRDRQQGGVMTVENDAEIAPYLEQYQTLGDLYQGNSSTEIQGAILIDAHYAATAAGITCTARPEDTIVAEDGTLFIAFTSGTAGGDGGPERLIFQGSNGETPYEYGWIMKLEEDENNPAALSFTWSMLALGGEPALGGAGFANPDNLTLDNSDHLWVVTDMSSGKQNQAVSPRSSEDKSLSPQELTGVFGNNTVWYIPLSGNSAGEPYPFALGPMECECTGPVFTKDDTSLFLSIQHPGEINGIRQNMALETREFHLLTTDGKSFTQQRQVPLGSNWPSGRVNKPPLPGVVAIRRINGRKIVT